MTACKVAPGDDGWCDERPPEVRVCHSARLFGTELSHFSCWCVRPPGHTGEHHCACCCTNWKAA